MKLLDQCRHTIRLKHYSYRTEQCYVAWIEQFIRFIDCVIPTRHFFRRGLHALFLPTCGFIPDELVGPKRNDLGELRRQMKIASGIDRFFWRWGG